MPFGSSSDNHDELIRELPDTGRLAALLKTLADPIRLRILGLLSAHELSVGELGKALGLSQSRVSNHLRVIREFRLLDERHVGPSTFLRLDPDAGNGADGEPGFLGRLWVALRPELEQLPEHAEDLARLRVVLDERRRKSRDFFDRVAEEWDAIGVEFASGQARQRLVASFIAPGLVIADLGCGTGYVAQAFLGMCRKIICVDRSGGMLDKARRRLAETHADTEVELRPGELDDLPFQADEVDGAVCAMVLHHLADPGPCLAEMFRSIRPGGTAVVLELAPHHEGWMHEELGDRHLGLDAHFVIGRFEKAGFEEVTFEVADDRYRPRPGDAEAALSGDGLSLYIVRGRVPRLG